MKVISLNYSMPARMMRFLHEKDMCKEYWKRTKGMYIIPDDATLEGY